MSCYKEVIGFDIEVDGSVGTVAVSGEIREKFNYLKEFDCQREPIDGQEGTKYLLIR